MPTNDSSSGVSNCYVFKSRLQEYAQKFKLPTPVYETIKEGSSHEPYFRSTVIVDGIRYDSLPGFFNRKAAEQSAAEVALLELAKSSELSECVSQPVHETGLCKNLLQEYAQKMNYAIPLYQCRKNETPGRTPSFSCTLEIGGVKYIGAAARTKKEAEISAARTALLAIQSESNRNGNSQLTVLPCRKRPLEQLNPLAKETANVPKAKKGRFRKKFRKAKPIRDPTGTTGNNGTLGTVVNQTEATATTTTTATEDSLTLQAEATNNCQGNHYIVSDSMGDNIETPGVGDSPHINGFKESFGSIEAGSS